MVFNNKLIKWLVINYYQSKWLKNLPGFIIIEYTNNYGSAFQRMVTIPEELFVLFENKLIESKKEDGKKILKKIGRELGYNYGYTIDAPTVKTKDYDFIKKYIFNMVNYASSGWSKDANIEQFNLAENSFKISYDQHVVCRKNGVGLLFKEGIIEGILSYIFQRNYVVINSYCQGRGDDLCSITLSANESSTPESYYKVGDMDVYRRYNTPRRLTYSSQSTSIILNSGIYKVQDGLYLFKDKCYFNINALFLYLLEKHLDKEGANILFEVAYDHGFNIISSNNLQEIVDYFAIFGYGDLFIREETENYLVNLSYFPWDILYDKINHFNYIAGLLSGMLSKHSGRKIRLNKSDFNLTDNNFSIKLS